MGNSTLNLTILPSLILVTIGILLAPDFLVPTPFMDILINTPLAMLIVALTGIEFVTAFALTWMLGFTLIFLGYWISPMSLKKQIHSMTNSLLAFAVASPHLIIAYILFLFIAASIANVWLIGLWEGLITKASIVVGG